MSEFTVKAQAAGKAVDAGATREAAKAAISAAVTGFKAQLNDLSGGEAWGREKLSPREGRAAFAAAARAVSTILQNLPKDGVPEEAGAALDAIRKALTDALPESSKSDSAGWQARVGEAWSQVRNSDGSKEQVADANRQNRESLKKFDQFVHELSSWAGEARARARPQFDLKW